MVSRSISTAVSRHWPQFGVPVAVVAFAAGLALLVAPPLGYAVYRFGNRMRLLAGRYRVAQSRLWSFLAENISGIREIKAFTREEVEAAHVSEHIDRYRDSMLNALRLMATFQPFVGFASSLGQVGLIYFGSRFVLNQRLPLEDLVAFFLYIGQLYQPVRALSGAWEGVQEALAGAERVAELLDEEPDLEIVGEASDDNLNEYVLAYAPASSDDFTEFATGTTPVPESTIAGALSPVTAMSR